MAEQIRIVADCDGLRDPHAAAERLFRFGAGSELRLLRDNDKYFYKVAFRDRVVFVPKPCAVRADSSVANEPLFVPSVAERIRIIADCDGLRDPHADAERLFRFGVGSELPLLCDDEYFYKAAYRGRVIFVAKPDAIRTVSSATEDAVFVPSSSVPAAPWGHPSTGTAPAAVSAPLARAGERARSGTGSSRSSASSPSWPAWPWRQAASGC